MSNELHIRTPLIESLSLGQSWGKRVFLKMENMQPTGSFKIRGIGLLCQTGKAQGVRRLVSSSGGNAGYAAAYAGRKLNIPTTVFVPSTTSVELVRQIEAQGSEVRIVGDVWDETHEAALRFSQEMEALYVSPFDHPLIWQGHSTIGASLSIAYQHHQVLESARRIVIIVCGGIGTSLEMLQTWRNSLEAAA